MTALTFMTFELFDIMIVRGINIINQCLETSNIYEVFNCHIIYSRYIWISFIQLRNLIQTNDSTQVSLPVDDFQMSSRADYRWLFLVIMG